MANIPGWPVLMTQWGAPYGSNGGTPPTLSTDLSSRVIGSIGAKVGKQYELDTAQAGELNVSLRNDDAVLDPVNSSSPFAGHIAPYQSISVQAQYPPSVNLLTNFQATGGYGYTTGTVPAGMGVLSYTDTTGGTIVAQSASPHDTAFSFSVPASSAAGQYIFEFTDIAAEPLSEYTFSTNLFNSASTASPQVQIVFGWYGPGSYAAPSTYSYGPSINLVYNTWYSISATATAPAGAAGLVVGVMTATSISSAYAIQTYNSQLQYGTLSAYADPGTWYPLFTGWIERWPSKWGNGGQYGKISATVVDTMALLSEGQLSDPLTEEIEYALATYCYPLSDPAGASQATEANGMYPPLNVLSTTFANGTLTFGNDITAANSSTGIFTAGGVDPTVVEIIPASSPNSVNVVGTSYLSLSESGITGPVSPGAYTRMIAFCSTAPFAVNQAYTLWSAYDNVAGGTGNTFQIGVEWGTTASTGSVYGAHRVGGLLASNILTPSGFNPCDGNWHLIMFGYNSVTGQVMISVDGQYSSITSSIGLLFTNAVVDSIGGNIWSNNQGVNQFQGFLAYAAEFPTVLTSTEVSNIYDAWYNACSGESATARYARILRYAKYTGPANLGNGVLTTDMGPATDLDGSDALTCLENVVVSENGTHYVAANGTLTFTGRGFRYNRPQPSFIFGENAAAGELPYEDLELDYDPTHLANDITVTQNFSSQNFYAINAASQLEYFDRTMTRTVNVNNPLEVQACAYFLAWRYGQPLTRVSSLTLNPAATAGLWAACLSIDVNTCIQVNRRPPGCPEISLLLWVENRQWTLGDDGKAKLVLQCSPAIPVGQAQFTVYQTEIAALTTVGSPTITVSPITDTVNPLNAFITPGDTWIIHANGAVPAETLVVESVQATGSSWTTGTITFTTNVAHAHPVGTAVTENSFAMINLDQYDANSVLGSVTFTY
jgi:hypothetical protein